MDIKERFYANLNMIREEAEQVDEAKDSYETYKKRMLGKAGNSPKDEGEWSKKMKKQEKAVKNK